MTTNRRAIAAFVAIAFTLSWTWWLGMLVLGLRVEPGGTASHLPGLMGPAIAAIIVTGLSEGRAGLLRLMRSCMRLSRPRVALMAAAMPVVLAGSVISVQLAMGHALPAYVDLSSYPGIPPGLATLPALIMILFLNGLGEELGWRGYLFPALLPRFGKVSATLIVAAIWLVWHLPLFFVNATMAALVGPMLIGWIVALTLGAFVLNHLYLATGRSVLAVALWHVSYNLCVATAATQGAVAAAVSTFVMAWGALVFWAWSRGRPLSGA